MSNDNVSAASCFSEAEIADYREALLKERDGLAKQIRSLSSSSLQANHQAGEELADIGSDDFIRETELALMSEEGQRLALINVALENLHSGSYGICIDCEKPIGAGRLKAKPYARLCIDCKSMREENGGIPPDGADELLVEV